MKASELNVGGEYAMGGTGRHSWAYGTKVEVVAKGVDGTAAQRLYADYQKRNYEAIAAQLPEGARLTKVADVKGGVLVKWSTRNGEVLGAVVSARELTSEWNAYAEMVERRDRTAQRRREASAAAYARTEELVKRARAAGLGYEVMSTGGGIRVDAATFERMLDAFVANAEVTA